MNELVTETNDREAKIEQFLFAHDDAATDPAMRTSDAPILMHLIKRFVVNKVEDMEKEIIKAVLRSIDSMVKNLCALEPTRFNSVCDVYCLLSRTSDSLQEIADCVQEVMDSLDPFEVSLNEARAVVHRISTTPSSEQEPNE